MSRIVRNPQPPSGKRRKLVLRFLVSPTEMVGDSQGRVTSMELVHNVLYATEAGTLRPRPGTLYRVLFLTGSLLFLITFFINTLADQVSRLLRKRYAQF